MLQTFYNAASAHARRAYRVDGARLLCSHEVPSSSYLSWHDLLHSCSPTTWRKRKVIYVIGPRQVKRCIQTFKSQRTSPMRQRAATRRIVRYVHLAICGLQRHNLSLLSSRLQFLLELLSGTLLPSLAPGIFAPHHKSLTSGTTLPNSSKSVNAQLTEGVGFGTSLDCTLGSNRTRCADLLSRRRLHLSPDTERHEYNPLCGTLTLTRTVRGSECGGVEDASLEVGALSLELVLAFEQ
eukprot:scaffold317500_cov43-Tisochrysis_lutea.AAC.1